MATLNWKDKFAAIIVLLIGSLYLILEVTNISSAKTSVYTLQANAIVVNKSELLAHVRSFATIITGVLGGILLLRGKSLGWIMGLPLLLITFILAVWGMVMVVQMQLFDAALPLYIGAFVALTLALLLLLRPAARTKYKIGAVAWVITFIYFIALGSVLYFLQ